MGWPYGYTINNLLTVLNMPKSVKDELFVFLKEHLRSLYKQADNAEIFRLNEINEKIKVYTKLASILNKGEILTLDDFQDRPMKKIKIKDG